MEKKRLVLDIPSREIIKGLLIEFSPAAGGLAIAMLGSSLDSEILFWGGIMLAAGGILWAPIAMMAVELGWDEKYEIKTSYPWQGGS